MIVREGNKENIPGVASSNVQVGGFEYWQDRMGKMKIKMTNICFDVIYRVMVKHSRLFHLHTFSVSSVV